jgi:hypothetical protein
MNNKEKIIRTGLAIGIAGMLTTACNRTTCEFRGKKSSPGVTLELRSIDEESRQITNRSIYECQSDGNWGKSDALYGQRVVILEPGESFGQ